MARISSVNSARLSSPRRVGLGVVKPRVWVASWRVENGHHIKRRWTTTDSCLRVSADSRMLGLWTFVSSVDGFPRLGIVSPGGSRPSKAAVTIACLLFDPSCQCDRRRPRVRWVSVRRYAAPWQYIGAPSYNISLCLPPHND
jgi:hypothetical protein